MSTESAKLERISKFIFSIDSSTPRCYLECLDFLSISESNFHYYSIKEKSKIIDNKYATSGIPESV